jgi:hypothetical protein
MGNNIREKGKGKREKGKDTSRLRNAPFALYLPHFPFPFRKGFVVKACAAAPPAIIAPIASAPRLTQNRFIACSLLNQ